MVLELNEDTLYHVQLEPCNLLQLIFILTFIAYCGFMLLICLQFITP